MLTLWIGVLLTAVIVVALYAFGLFSHALSWSLSFYLLSATGSAHSFHLVWDRRPSVRGV